MLLFGRSPRLCPLPASHTGDDARLVLALRRAGPPDSKTNPLRRVCCFEGLKMCCFDWWYRDFTYFKIINAYSELSV